MANDSTFLRQQLPNATERRKQLLSHDIYHRITGAQSARVFMGFHVFAVWDFMSLLKSLQRHLTCVTVPWVPPIDRASARLINEIVLVEESDEDGHGHHAGHYDIYVEAMAHVGADVRPIERFVAALRSGADLDTAFAAGAVPLPQQRFVSTTIDIAKNGQVEEVAAAFFLGREDVIPEMFSGLLTSLQARDGRMTERLNYYLARHIAVDADTHGPAAERLLVSLCDDDPTRWARADACACRAIDARIALWDAVISALPQ